LENIGFLFRAKGAEVQSEIEKKNKREKGEQKWLLHFEEICKYKEVNGNCLVPKLYKANRALASWCVCSSPFSITNTNFMICD
jgi:hypothetical protein